MTDLLSGVVDVCAGPGGWEEGFKLAGIDTSDIWGYEISEVANATARAAGHRRIEADISEVKPEYRRPARGHVGSPPCGSFSSAGLQRGIKDSVLLNKVAATVRSYDEISRAIPELHEEMTDERSILVLEPLRWALAHRPQWLAWEQVPQVQPIWDACAVTLRELGYSVDTRVLHAEQYGVPQSRKRSVLVARRVDTERALGLEHVQLPDPVHARFDPSHPEKRKTHTLPAPVSIRDALGNAGLTAPDDSWVYLGAGVTSQRTAGTKARPLSFPASTATGKGTAYWVHNNGGPDQAIKRVSVEELGVIQSFPANYPWQGKTHQRYQQVGDAIPPMLASHIIRAVTKGLT